jgi:hypothetical protein
MREREHHYLEKAIVAGLIILFWILGVSIVNADETKATPNPYDLPLSAGFIAIEINNKPQTICLPWQGR